MLKHLRLEQCDSTQDELKRHFEVYQLVTTEQQNQGRGRGQNAWEHRPGALAFSFTAPAHPQMTWQALEVAVSLSESLERLWNVRVDLKWPNDLYRHGRKCGGILLQHQAPHMFIGVGINVLPSDQSPWGSILDKISPWKLSDAHDIPARLVEDYLSMHPRPINLIKAEWLKRCAHLGKRVAITEGTEIFSGEFQGLGVHGEALVDGKSIYNGTLRWT